MKQTVCDACGSVIKNEPHRVDVWSTNTTDTLVVFEPTLTNQDICFECWDIIRNRRKNDQ